MKAFVGAGVLGAGLAVIVALAMGVAPSGIVLSSPPAAAPADPGLNVIMVMWDGVRIDELMERPDKSLPGGDGPPLMPYFWGKLAPTGEVYGDLRQGKSMTVANTTMISLPAYESIFTGSTQPCDNNDCNRIGRESFPERIHEELRLPRRQVATVASWEGLMFAVESHPGRTFVNAGAADFHEYGDAEEAALNAAQKADPPPWPDCRFDKYTWRQSMRYLERERPRFMFISLDDADGWGHRGVYKNYLAAIRQYDEWLHELVERLGVMGAYGQRTCLIVTTDHGRGRGDQWTTHSNGTPYSGLVAMYGGCPLAPGRVRFRPPSLVTTHLDIRPTVETLFGLDPYRCLLCGASLAERVESAAKL